MTRSEQSQDAAVVEVLNKDGAAPVVLVCEHASAFIPDEFGTLGLSQNDLCGHTVWDPGAMAVARHMSRDLNAALVASRVSRLVYDCNRPPTALDAMPAKSERVEVPGNAGLSKADKDARAAAYYLPFRDALGQTIDARHSPAVVTLHSFTPVYHGARREVEIGILHDADTRLADAMLAIAADHTPLSVERNSPYGPTDGVTHTLKVHALPDSLHNVMIEIRNDLIATADAQQKMAACLTGWVTAALAQAESALCKA